MIDFGGFAVPARVSGAAFSAVADRPLELFELHDAHQVAGAAQALR